MKKTLMLLLAVMVFAVMGACASSGAGDTAPAKETAAVIASVPAAEKIIGSPNEPTIGPKTEAVRGTPAVIDGTMDPVFANAPVIETELLTQGDETTAHATGRLAWDDKYLYVYIEVKDPVLSDKNPNDWEQDSVEVYIDEMNYKSMIYKPGIAQYRVNYKGKASGGSGARVKMAKYGARIVDGGYNVTLAIPFGQGKPQAGNWIGFDLQTNDDGKGNGVRSGIKDWANKTNNNYQDASMFGNVKLLP